MVEALLAARWILAVMLLCAGVAKLADRQRFAEAIARYSIVPSAHLAAVAAVLPVVEALVGVALALGFVPMISASCAGVLLFGFALAVAVNLVRGRRFDCGCGGALGGEIGWRLVARNAGLAAVAAAVAVGPAGLAVSTGALAGGGSRLSAGVLLPVPLTVIALLGLIRCVQSYAAGRLVRRAG
jgi:hypothetical protein